MASVEDVTQQTGYVSSPQPEAVQNIQSAKLVGTDPETFKANKDLYRSELNQIDLPQFATKTVAQNMSIDPEHTAAIAPDATHLSTVEQIWDDVKNKVNNRVGPEQKRNEILWKKLNNGGKLDEGDEMDLLSLNDQLQNVPQRTTDELGNWGLVGDVAAGITDIGAVAVRNKETIAKIAAAEAAVYAAGGAVAGAALGAPAAAVGAVPGAAAGALAGAGRGAIAGTFHGYLAASFIDGYKNTAASVYGQLDNSKAPDGTPINVSEENKQYISHGVGVINGALMFGANKVLLKNVPFLKDILRNSVSIVGDPANEALKSALIGIGKSAMTMGGAAALQEMVSIVGEEIGNTQNANSQVSFVNGLLNAAEKIKSNEGGTGERVLKAGAVGSLIGATAHVGGMGIQKIVGINAPLPGENAKNVTPEAPPGAPRIGEPGRLYNMEPDPTPNFPKAPSDIVGQQGTPHARAIEVLQVQDAVDSASKIAKGTKLYGLNKGQVLDMQKQMVEDGLPSVYFDKEGLSEVADNETKAERIRNLIDPSGTAAAALNAPIRVDTHKFLELTDEYPTLSEYMKLNPEGPNPKSAKAMVDKHEAAQAERADIQAKLGVKGITPEEKATLEQALNTPQPVNDIFGEEDYLSKPTFTKAIEGVISENKVYDFNKANREAKQAVIDNIDETAKYEMNKVIDIQTEHATDTQFQIEENRLLNSPNLAVLENFTSPESQIRVTNRRYQDSMFTDPHHKEGYSKFAIDPRQLSEEQKRVYLKDPQLKKHKVFVKGGIDPDEAAYQLGVRNGDQLLRILADTPTREEIVARRVEGAGVRDQVAKTVDLNHTAIANAYHAKTANNLAEMKTFLDMNLATWKQGAKKLLLKLPRIEELTNKAQAVVGKTKVGNLNVNQFKVGERRSHSIVVKALLDHDLEKAFINKEAEALNTELSLATHIAVGEVNRTIRIGKKFDRPEVIQELKDAGKSYIDAANELLDVFDLSPSKKGLSERGTYLKWVNDQVRSGNGNFNLPDETVKRLKLEDTRQSLNDMTVDEVKAVGERLNTILHLARLKNELLLQHGPEAQAAKALENLSEKFKESDKDHPDFDKARIVKSSGHIGFWKSKANGFSNLVSMLKNMEHIGVNIDNGVVGGLFNESVVAPLKGIGKYKGQGAQGAGADKGLLLEHFKAIVKKFGQEEHESNEDKFGKAAGLLNIGKELLGRTEWQKLQNEIVTIPEFANMEYLSYGKLSKANLLVMMLNSGNEGNIKKMVEGFTHIDSDGTVISKTDIETIRTVLDRELDSKHADMVQHIFDTYKTYYPRVVKLQEEMTGSAPEMVEAAPWTHKGVVRPGGYYPIITDSEMSVDKIRKRSDTAVDLVSGDKKFNLDDHFYTDDMTKHGHTEKRTGSIAPISLSIDTLGFGFETIIHDLNFRKPIRDALAIVLHPSISKSIAGRVGVNDYNVVVNTIVNAASSIQMENSRGFKSDKTFEQIRNKARSGLSVGYIVGNASSLAIQPLSMAYAIERMGAHGHNYILNTVATVMSNPHMIFGEGGLYEFAGEIHPQIADHQLGLDDNQKDALVKLLPKGHLIPGTAPIDAIRQLAIEGGFAALGFIDQFMKVIIAPSAYAQFVNGDAPGYSYEKVSAMSDADRDHQAKVYASSVTRLTLTAGDQLDRSPFQREHKEFAMFQNDPRNALNNTFRMVREVSQSAKQGKYGKAAFGAVSTLVFLGLAKVLNDLLRGEKTPMSGDLQATDPRKFDEQMMNYLATSSIQTVGSDIPIVNSGLYGINWYLKQDKTWNRQPLKIQTVESKMLEDTGNTVVAALTFMEMVKGKVSKQQTKATAMTLSYVTGGVPVGALFKFYDYLKKINPNGTAVGPTQAEDYAKKLEEFKKNHSQDVRPEAMKALEDIGAQLAPAKKSSPLDNQNSKVKD